MPATINVLIRTIRSIKKNIGNLEKHYGLDQAMQETRRIIKEEIKFTFKTLHVPLAVWLLKHFTQKDPEVVTVIDTLNDPDLMPSQSLTAKHISVYLKGSSKGKKGILIKKDNGDCLSLNFSIMHQIDAE